MMMEAAEFRFAAARLSEITAVSRASAYGCMGDDALHKIE